MAENESENYLTDDQNKCFGDFFLKKYLLNGFGAMTKSEMDILIFHLLSQSEKLKDESNYIIANELKITESKVKSLRLNAALKYNQANHKAVLANIVLRIIGEMEKPDFNDGQVMITIENPVEQRELDRAIKLAGRNIEHGFNKELFKISPIALFELIFSNLENSDKEFKRFIQNHIADKKEQNKIIGKALTLRQKVNNLGEEINDKVGLIRLLGAAGGALG